MFNFASKHNPYYTSCTWRRPGEEKKHLSNFCKWNSPNNISTNVLIGRCCLYWQTAKGNNGVKGTNWRSCENMIKTGRASRTVNSLSTHACRFGHAIDHWPVTPSIIYASSRTSCVTSYFCCFRSANLKIISEWRSWRNQLLLYFNNYSPKAQWYIIGEYSP